MNRKRLALAVLLSGVKGRSFIYGLPARSVTTFKWPGRPGAGVEVWVTTADQIKLLERQQPVEFY